ncbi:ATP-binding protein [Bacteriovorax sp. PP10]|uniref:histidine kinase n=1 Tax=Bacteriovorax antarcticus TaxID=3088717 RepID=A0ABU5VV57_9BACT|nr:ATP-binding protein [Bacteriovorax sp. PP10]MEA9356288.1 ATP-binding protein [Bacteriovorax sp. PP10]
MKNFDRKIYFGLIFITLIFLPALASSIYSLHKVINTQKIIEKYTEQLIVSGDLRRLKNYQLSLIPIYVLKGDPDILNEINKNNETFTQLLQDFEKMSEDITTKKILTDIKTTHLELSDLQLPTIRKNHISYDKKEINEYIKNITAPKSRLIMANLNKIVKRVSDQYEHEKQDNTFASQNIMKTLLVTILLTIVLVALTLNLLLKTLREKKIHDKISEQVAKKEKELSNARKETIEVVAHDLKNPLSSIIMTAHLITNKVKKQNTKEFKHREDNHLDRILKAALSMKKLIEELLDHSRIESNSLVLVKKRCNLETLLETLSSRFEPIFKTNELHFEQKIQKNLAYLFIDEGRIEQVITNIIGNAVKFTPRSGFIKLEAYENKNDIVISVSDTGPGINNNEIPYIFERYWQARKTAAQGTGLGLAISSSIAKAHGGKITVQSEINKGSTFSLILPNSKNLFELTQIP